MKNINLYVSQNQLFEDTFCISRANHSYSFFATEYKNLPYDSEGNILLRYPLQKEKSIVNKVLDSIKECFLRDDKSIGITLGSQEYSYFRTEYISGFSEDINHNIIIPEEEYPTVKTKKN